MDATLHAPPSSRPPTRSPVASARTLAALTAGVGIGVLAALPLGGGTAWFAVLAIVAASAAATVVVFRPSSTAAMAAADVALGIAVLITVFGDLGLLYVPFTLAFLVLTARVEKAPERAARGSGLAWEPAPEFEEAMPLAVAAPSVPAEEESATLEPAAQAEPAFAEPISALLHVEEPTVAHLEEPLAGDPEPVDTPDLSGPELVEMPALAEPETQALGVGWSLANEAIASGPLVIHIPEAPPSEAPPMEPRGHHAARHRAPSPVRRVAAAAARVSRRLGDHAKAGMGNLRPALVDEPTGLEPPDPADEIDELEEGFEPRIPEVTPPAPELDELRHQFEERELDLVAAGKGWSGLTHRAYGELRFLPAPPPPPRPRKPSVEIDDLDWDPPTWKTMDDT